MAAGQKKPTCISLVVAERVEMERGHSNILGAFNVIYPRDFPVRLKQIALMMSLTGGDGDYVLRLDLEDDSTGRVIFSSQRPDQPTRIEQGGVRDVSMTI